MRTLLAQFAVLLVAALAAPGAEGWRVYRSPHFEITTTAGAEGVHAALERLEAVRRQLREAEAWLPAPRERVRILAFSSEKEFEPYRSSSQSPAYFASGPEGDLIVLGRLAEESLPVLAHEYVHAALRQAGTRLPLWLEEGLAELYSGRPAPARRQPRIGPPELVGMEAQRPPAPGVRASGSLEFYRTSRRVVHLLRHHPGYAPRWPNLLLRASAGSLLAEGPLERLAEDASRFTAPYPAAPAPESARIEWRNAVPGERAWLCALALARLGRQRAALSELDEVETAEGHALAGRILTQMGDPRAAERLRRAFALGTRDEHALWQLVVFEQDHAGSPHLLPALERVLEVNAERDDARLILASHYLSRAQFEQARGHLRLVRQAPPEHEAYYRRALEITGLGAESSPETPRFRGATPSPVSYPGG